MPGSGQVFLGGEDVTYRRGSERDIAFVVSQLYPHMNVRRNTLPCASSACPRRGPQRTKEVARLLRIDHLLDRPVGGLSSGDRQLVALGRAIVRRAKAS